MMNIAFITPYMTIGGAESYIITKAEYFCSTGHNVLVVSAGGENVSNLPKEAKHIKFATDVPPFAISDKEINGIVDELTKILIDNNIDVVESHNTYPVLYALLACNKAKIPFLYNLLSELSHQRQYITNDIAMELSKIGRYYTLTPQMNIFVEQHLKCKLNSIVIPIPVREVKKFDNKSEVAFVLSVCRFSSEKMYVLSLINGFAQAVKNGLIDKVTRLKIVGGGSMKEAVVTVAERANSDIGYNQIELLGTVIGDDLDKLFRECKIYVGMGTTILMAAQCNKPIIKTSVLDEKMKFAWGYWGDNSDDKYSIVSNCTYDKPISYAKSLEVLNNDEELAKYAKKANDIYETTYNKEIIMKQWEREYSRIISQGFVFDDQTIKKILIKIKIYRVLRKIYRVLKKIKRLVIR